MTTASVARDGSETTGSALQRVHFGGFELLRAIAALMVVAHHAGSLAGTGRTGPLHTFTEVMDAGVAVFFVLSGFLIYRPFVAAHAAARRPQRPLAFWWRRVLRIVPAYWVALTFFWAIGCFHLGDQWWRFYLFLQIYSPTTALNGIIQSWSLCTEMSFYLLIPFWVWAVGLLARRATSARGRALWHLAGCAVLYGAGITARILVADHWPSRRQLAFDWLPTNLDLFATGMALAVVSVWAVHDDGLRARLDRLARWVGPWWLAAGVLFAWYAIQVGPADFLVGYSGWFWHRRQLSLGVMTALLMIPAVFGPQDRGWERRVWSWRPLVWLGTVSYGIYLWHFDWMKRSIASANPPWPGWVHTTPGDSSFVYLMAVGLGFGIGFAALSWYGLERPLQRFKGLVGTRGALGAAEARQ